MSWIFCLNFIYIAQLGIQPLKFLDWVLTSGHVGSPLELGADAPEADLEGDGGDDVDVG